MNEGKKQCKGPCGRWLPATTEFFYINNRVNLKSKCKMCHNDWRNAQKKVKFQSSTKEQQKELTARHNAVMRAYARRHKDERNAYSKTYQHTHREKANAYKRAWRQRRKDESENEE